MGNVAQKTEVVSVRFSKNQLQYLSDYQKKMVGETGFNVSMGAVVRHLVDELISKLGSLSQSGNQRDASDKEKRKKLKNNAPSEDREKVMKNLKANKDKLRKIKSKTDKKIANTQDEFRSWLIGSSDVVSIPSSEDKSLTIDKNRFGELKCKKNAKAVLLREIYGDFVASKQE